MKKAFLTPVICAFLFVSCNTGNNPSGQPMNNSNGNGYGYGNNNANCNGNCSMQSNNSQPSDWDITSKVKERIMNEGSISNKARMISVSTNNGVVTLSGTVVSDEEGRKIVRMAQKVKGVVSVDNQLTVDNS